MMPLDLIRPWLIVGLVALVGRADPSTGMWAAALGAFLISREPDA